ncbi:MAG: Holliday junction resolvase RuvX [Oscillospiraceae bacterium]|jgi:putative Holliday junction resolvase|nr:Holliday junction resolvase RuvX [Oscillospiraceae bacterium]
MKTGQRVLCIDYGDVRSGIAVSDALGVLAVGLGTVRPKGMRELTEIIKAKADEYNVGLIVVGNPVNMNGTAGPRSERARAFAEKLEAALSVEVVLFDERCTTLAAHRILNETDTRGKKRKDVVDTLSAQIILQNYMDSHKK